MHIANEALLSCVNCFLLKKNKQFKEYRVIQKSNYQLFEGENDWTALDELLLLEGIGKCGLGNWGDIATLINKHSPNKSPKNKQQVKQHYDSVFMQKAQANREIYINYNWYLQNRMNELFLPEQSRILSSLKRRKSNPPKSGTTSLQKDQLNVNDQNKNGVTQNKNQVYEQLGYMEKRKDFESEYDPDAELLLAEMEFNSSEEEDNGEERETKYQILEIYNMRLDERIKRKKFLIERGLIDYQSTYQAEKQMPKEEREVQQMMKQFMRFNTTKEHNELVKNLVKEKELVKQIQFLQQLQSDGIRSQKDIEEYMGMDSEEAPRMQTRKTQDQQSDSLFTQHELQLIGALHMEQEEYLIIKEIMVRDTHEKGYTSLPFLHQYIQFGTPSPLYSRQTQTTSHFQLPTQHLPNQGLVIYSILISHWADRE